VDLPLRLAAFGLILTAGAGLAQRSTPVVASGGLTRGGPTPAPASTASAATTPARPRLGAAAQRNENVAVYLIDTNAVKEANIRVGTTPTAVSEPSADTQHWATEHGQRPAETLSIRPQTVGPGWHGEASWAHQNSVFNARTFFQVGGVKPSHRNLYGGRVTGLVPKFGFLTVTYGQNDIRGMVNGNVLVPLENERTPLAVDPETRAIVQRFLNAYPTELPNRPDFDIRALNTNSPQRIDTLRTTARLDRDFGSRHRLLLSYGIDRQNIQAFQLVAGQNPDTALHSQNAKATWLYSPNALTQAAFTAAYQRNRSVLVSEPNAVGPRVRVGFQIEELGPDSMFPIDRAANTFRYGAAVSKLLAGGTHQLTFGADLSRFQLNGIESGNMRGYFQFTNNFGRSAIENIRLGTPSMYEISIGELSRGYRNWLTNAYVADKWKIHPRFSLYLGLRYMADTRPVEVHRMETIPYGTDANNFSPRIAFTWQPGRGWLARGMYTTAFSQILPVTYQQTRNNPPHVIAVMVPDPSLADPLHGIDIDDPNAPYTPTWLSPDLATPYSHQYNFSIEREVARGAMLRTSYIGSRTVKVLNSFIMNRAEPVPGIPLTSGTVNQRRPDPRFYETRTIVNGGLAWFDAGQVALDVRARHGLSGSVGYTISKGLDEGPDFSGTAANKDILSQRSQWQYDSFADRKGLSTFDSTHALVLSYAYDVPSPRNAAGWLRFLGSNWQLSGVNLWKTGTPSTMYIGSDAPGFGNVDGGPSDRPNIVDPSILGMTISHPNIATQILRRDRFAYIRPGERRGNLGRNTFRKANIWNWNASVARQFRLPNDWTGQFRVEAYNLSNTPQFDEPQRNLTSPSFGKVTNTLNDGRVFQVGFRILI
jgi:hypothetical protein